jgi:hypothetical protein
LSLGKASGLCYLAIEWSAYRFPSVEEPEQALLPAHRVKRRLGYVKVVLSHTLGIALDHLTDKQSRLHYQPGPAATTRAHGMTEHAHKGRDIAGQAIHTDQYCQAWLAHPRIR